MKKILFLVLFIFSCVVTGCKEKNYIEFKTDNIVMEYNSNLTIEYEIHGKVENIKFSVENEKIIAFSNNILKAKNPGETKLICTYNENKKIDINVKVLKKYQKIFSLGNPEENEKNFNRMNADLNEFSQTMKKSNYSTYRLNAIANGQKSSQIVYLRNNPMHIEVISNGERSIICQENQKLFEYYIKNKKVERNFIGYVNGFNFSQDIINSKSMIEVSAFDKNKCNIVVEENTYTITCLLKDSINQETKKIIEEIIKSTNLNPIYLMETVLTIQYVFYEDKLYVSTACYYDFEEQGIDFAVKLNINFEIDLNEFTPTDIFNENYTISLPDCIEEVYKSYVFGEGIYVTAYGEEFVKIELDRGMIFVNNKVQLKLYDKYNNLVSESMGHPKTRSYIPLDSFVIVPKADTYYLLISSKETINKIMDIQFYPYETVVNEEGIDLSNITSLEGKIEGKYDLEKFIYNKETKDEQTVSIKNNGNQTIVIYNNSRLFQDYFIYIKPGEEKGITLIDGMNELYLCQNFLSTEHLEGYDYNITIKLYNFNIGSNVYEGDIPQKISINSFETRYYYTYLEEGMYSISEGSGFDYVEIIIRDKNGRKIDANIAKHDVYTEDISSYFVINKADYYYVGMENSISASTTLTFKEYNYSTIFNKNNPYILKVNDSNEGTLEGLHDFECYKLENTSNITHIYALTNTSQKRISFIMQECEKGDTMIHSIAPNDEIYFASYPGDMYITIGQNRNTSIDESVSYSFAIEELINNNITDKKSPNLVEITEEFTENYYLAGYSLPSAYFKINILKKGILEFKLLGYNSKLGWVNVILENKYGQRINYEQAISPGEYYVKLTNNDMQLGYVKIKYKLTPA